MLLSKTNLVFLFSVFVFYRFDVYDIIATSSWYLFWLIWIEGTKTCEVPKYNIIYRTLIKSMGMQQQVGKIGLCYKRSLVR